MFLILTVYPGTYKYSSVYTESPSIYIIDSVNLFRKTGFFGSNFTALGPSKESNLSRLYGD